jgi:hypothetical protein
VFAELRAPATVRIAVGIVALASAAWAVHFHSLLESGYTIGRYEYAIQLISENLEERRYAEIESALRQFFDDPDRKPDTIARNLPDRRRPQR